MRDMKRKYITLLFALCGMTCMGQTFETKYERSLHDVMTDVENRFGVRLKYDVDTTGMKVTYADFRIRPYSEQETLTNLLSPLDLVAVHQKGNQWRIRRYDYPRRQPEDGKKLIAYLSSLYHDRISWEARRDSLRREVAERLGINPLRRLDVIQKNELGSVRQHDGYTVQNFRLSTI